MKVAAAANGQCTAAIIIAMSVRSRAEVATLQYTYLGERAGLVAFVSEYMPP